MKELTLTQGKIALVDDEDYDEVSQFNWQYARNKSGNEYAQRYTGLNPLTLHEHIMKPDKGFQVDHRDGNGLNCQRKNMRLCTHQQNCMNKKKWRGKSRFKGVMYKSNCPKNPWRAYITHNYKQIGIGFYKTEELAALAYNRKAKELFGEFACLNDVFDNQVERYLALYSNTMRGQEICPRGLDCREVEDQQIVIHPDYPFMTFKHRNYDVGYFKKEFLWKLTANPYDRSIQNHAKLWKEIINPDGTYNSNYGRFFFGPGHNIWDIVTELTRDMDSRKAYIPMLNVTHMAPHVIDTVCTLGVGFRVRNGRLDMSCYMRSSDIIFGLATDIPTFAFLYRLVKGLLPMDLEVGYINVTAMSSHVYSRHYEMVTKILNDSEYEPVMMPYCNREDAMKIISSRGNHELLETAGGLGQWLISE